MKRVLLCLMFLAAIAGSALRAQDITGTWQGTLHIEKDIRIILKISRDDGRLKAVMYSIDQGAQPIIASSARLDGSDFKCSIDVIGGSFQGKLSTDGTSIVGTWTQGPNPLPLTLVRATTETAWDIPAPPPPPKMMPADADPTFEVATIKPNPSTATSMQQLTINNGNFVVRNGSLGDLIGFAYGVHIKQIVGGPDWINTERYDISAKTEPEGAPSPDQLRTMIRKLLADRFKLTFHHEKRDLSAYVLTIAKTGQKLTPTQMKGPLPGLGFSPSASGLMLNVRNGMMSDFTGFLQNLVLDKPVVNQTGLTERFDFHVTFTPDDSQFNGHPPKIPPATDTTESSPSLFEALQQQLGLKLTAEKAPVDVLVIDHVEKHSEN